MSLQQQYDHVIQSGLIKEFELNAKRFKIPISILLGVASRESRIGLALDSAYAGDHGYGKGIMQIDKRFHEFARTVRPNDHASNIEYASSYLRKRYEEFNSWSHALSAYNAGAGNVRRALRNGKDPDEYTTGKDYAKDVLKRAQFFKNKKSSIVPLIGTISMIAIGYYYFKKKG